MLFLTDVHLLRSWPGLAIGPLVQAPVRIVVAVIAHACAGAPTSSTGMSRWFQGVGPGWKMAFNSGRYPRGSNRRTGNNAVSAIAKPSRHE